MIRIIKLYKYVSKTSEFKGSSKKNKVKNVANKKEQDDKVSDISENESPVEIDSHPSTKL